jgi:hypothetical protein
MQYIVYDGESRDVRFEGECTNTLKDDSILARRTGPDGPVSIKCSSASPNPRDSICYYILRQRLRIVMSLYPLGVELDGATPGDVSGGLHCW